MNFTASAIEKTLKLISCHVKYIPSESFKASEFPNESKISRRSSRYSSFPAEMAQREVSLKADLHGTTLSHTTSLRQAYDMNCFV